MTIETVNERGVPAAIASQLRSLIARGTLAPGMRLGQTELAEQFQASRVPVREALKLLSSEGLVEHDPNRGFFVTKLTRDEADQLFTLRNLVEDELMRSIEWPDEAVLAEFERRAERLEELLDAGDRMSWWDEHREFHAAIFNLSPKKTIVREAMRLWMLTDRFRALLPLPRRPSEERRVVNKHSLLQALRARDHRKLVSSRKSRREAFARLVLETLEARGL
ncbi:MAG: GntR family transcriptional regulator [Sphingomonas sp.]